MNHDHDIEGENIAATIARESAKPAQILETNPPGGGLIHHVALPKGYELKSIDNEATLARPRFTAAAAKLVDVDSFLAYVANHDAGDGQAAVWCDFNPVTYELTFKAVIDEHGYKEPAWRKHTAVFTPRLSVEWGIWLGRNRKEHTQVQFAEFIESNEKDIAGGEGLPSSLQMMTMATAFEANSEKRFKSKVRLQSGGVALEYVNTDDDATIEQMKLFEKFQIGIPVFWSLRKADEAVQAWPITARLKYKAASGAVQFWYDLIRPDLIHERAALQMIEKVRAGLGPVPLRMGACS
jgi:uncharacterized protein YfdQ (DUF2303 family)